MGPGEQLYIALVHAARRLGALDSELGLSPARFSLLATLRYQGPQNVSRLAQLEHVTQPTITKLVNALERDGLVERRPDPADGRASAVHLTSTGRALVRRARARKIAYVDSVIVGVDGSTVIAIAGALEEAATPADGLHST